MKRALIGIAGLLVVSSVAQAQKFPNGPIKVVTAYAAGGSSDIGLRIVAQKLTESGWPSVIVENRPGGGGTVAAQVVKQAPPDGYTLLQSDISGFAINKTLLPDFPYDPIKDFTPITITWSFPSVLVVPSTSSVKTAAELIALAKSKPGGVNYASQGVGSGGHLLGTMFQNALGVPMVHVPYRGAGAAMPDVVAGRVDYIFASYGSVKQYADAGSVRILATTAKRRMPELQSVPTMTEIGQPSVFLDVWFGLSGPAGMPADVVKTIHLAVEKVLHTPETVNKLAEIGLYAETSTPARYGKMIGEDIDRLGKIVKDANIKQQ
ncbi:MAG: Bug family tripartite tricarboxylate transporter substrate binding protein [Xanthobacteraceae bacterium]